MQINRALKPDGLFLAALLGGETLKELRESWLLAEEEHVDFIEKQQQMIRDQGLQNYIQLQSEAAGS